MQLLCPLPVAGGGVAGAGEEPVRLSLDLTYLEDDSLPASDDPCPPEEGAEMEELEAGEATADSTEEVSAAEDAGTSEPPSPLAGSVDDGVVESEVEATADEADCPDASGVGLPGPAPPA